MQTKFYFTEKKVLQSMMTCKCAYYSRSKCFHNVLLINNFLIQNASEDIKKSIKPAIYKQILKSYINLMFFSKLL